MEAPGTLIAVRGLLWLRLDADGDVTEIEVSGDTSWMTLDPVFKPFDAVTGRRVTSKKATKLFDELTDSSRWATAELTLAN